MKFHSRNSRQFCWKKFLLPTKFSIFSIQNFFNNYKNEFLQPLNSSIIVKNLNDISKIKPTISDQQESLWKIQKNINRISLKKLLLLLLDRIKIQEKRKNWSPSTFDSNENGKIIKKKKKIPSRTKKIVFQPRSLGKFSTGGGGWPPFIPGDSLTNTDYEREPRKRRDKTRHRRFPLSA